MVCYVAIGNHALMYSARVVCTYTSISDHILSQRLRLPQASFAVEPVSNIKQLARRNNIIPPMPTWKTPSALSKASRQNVIIARMYAQEGYFLASHYAQRDSTAHRSSDSD